MSANGLGGDAEKQEQLGEYDGLVRYISTYRDKGAASIAGGNDEEEAPKKGGLFSKKKAGSDGVFDTPPDWLNTDWKSGLTTQEVEQRRKKTGWNELTTEKENLFIKFLGFFTGPILYGLSFSARHGRTQLTCRRSNGDRSPPRSWSA